MWDVELMRQDVCSIVRDLLSGLALSYPRQPPIPLSAEADSPPGVLMADRWFPSTKTCSGCGAVKDMPLSQREYVCHVCGMVEDRDLNAARNLERYPGLRGNPYACEHPSADSVAVAAG